MKQTRPTIFMVAAMLLLTGCAQFERNQPVAVTDDDAYCRANGVAVGSADYAACLKNRDVQRSNAIARADRAQRNLGEYMLNNPNRP